MLLFIRSDCTPMPKKGLATEWCRSAMAAVSCARSVMPSSSATLAWIGAAPSVFRRTESRPIL